MSLVDRYRDALPGRADIMAWITQVVEHGVRRPGSDAGRRVERWCAARFEELGLQDVRLEPFDVSTWEPGEARLIAWPEGRRDEAIEMAGTPLPYTQPTDGHEAELALLGPEGGGRRVDGAIAVDVIELGELPGALMREIATAGVDPTGELDELVHLLPCSFRQGHEVDSGIDAGASGYVGVLATMPWDTRDYYLPYDAVHRSLPALWLERRDGARLTGLLAQGAARGRIEVAGRSRSGHSANVLGTLPGASDQWVVIGSHHDAPWASAVEDGSGVALVLAQARFWAQVPAHERPHNLLFLLNGGHMAGSRGAQTFAERHRQMFDEVVLAVHLEHAAAACRPEDGDLVATDDPEVRWWFTAQDPALEDAVVAALATEELGRSWVLPPDAFYEGEAPPTDGGFFHGHGVPIVDLLSAPVYLFDACDTLDKIHQPSLEPLTRATVRIIESLAGRTASELRAASVEAHRRRRRSRPTDPTGGT